MISSQALRASLVSLRTHCGSHCFRAAGFLFRAAVSFLLSDYGSASFDYSLPTSLHRKRQTFIKCEQTNSISVPKLENLLTKAISNLGQFAGVTLIFRTTGLRARSTSS